MGQNAPGKLTRNKNRSGKIASVQNVIATVISVADVRPVKARADRARRGLFS